MFEKARIKLTSWYLAIIMVISLSFSVAIYVGVNRELVRFDALQQARQQRADQFYIILRTNGLPLPPENSPIESETLETARIRIITSLGLINLAILLVAGAGGYFLAGQTLEPIGKMVDEQKEFVSDASHELRTPITSLKTEIEVALRDKNLSLKDTKALLSSNLEDVNKMQRLANYLLKLNRYEEGGSIPMAKVDLRDIVRDAVGKRKVKMALHKSIITGNKDAISELATILTDNALKYGGGKSVEVRCFPEGIIEVEDHGKGISKEDIPHIFDRFYRSDKSRGTDGYGLGLAIAKSIVDLHHGSIEVESKPGKGTRFRVTL